ncbi:MAG: LVIVD repeat-containing protein [Actinomycetota bacterium]
MRKTAILGLAVLLAGVVVPADAGPSHGGISSNNVEFIRHIPISIDGVGGRVVGKWFYTNDQNKIMIFDISKPEDPQLTGVLPMPQEWLFSREDLDTNGEILIMPNTAGAGSVPPDGLGTLYVIDVEDKSNPQIVGTAPGGQHTQSCILDCRWAYGSDGAIHDLRNPAKPKRLKKKWGEGLPAQGGHDVEEIAPGIVLTATQPIMLLDVRKNPTEPKLLALGANDDGRFIHTVRWARGTKDKFIVAGGETNFRARCGENNGAFMTWDASNWRKTRTFNMIDEYRMKNGTYTDGNPTVNQGGCSSHWLEPHPDFRNGGIVAVAFFEHGTRFIDVSPTGKIKEIGYFMPWAGSTGAAYWVTDKIVYAVDYNRGIDILRFKGKK